jgi:hypothetical protein
MTSDQYMLAGSLVQAPGEAFAANHECIIQEYELWHGEGNPFKSN